MEPVLGDRSQPHGAIPAPAGAGTPGDFCREREEGAGASPPGAGALSTSSVEGSGCRCQHLYPERGLEEAML